MSLGHDYRMMLFNIAFWIIACYVFPVVIFTLVSLIGKGVGLFWPPASHIFNALALVTAGGCLCMSAYGSVFGWRRLTVDRITINSPKIPVAFDDYKIVQLSDFHIGTYALSPGAVRKIVDRVNSLDPDLIVFTGDLVNSDPAEVEEFVGELSRLKARDGVLSVLGNHDYCLYREYKAPDNPVKACARLRDKERKMGWRLLLNESAVITRGSDTLAIIGVENAGSRNFPDRSDLKGAMEGVDSVAFKILLSHDPSHWEREVVPDTDIDLTLSGHTHAMQLKIGGWSPSKWIYPEWGGLYDDGAQKLYVSTGVGENIPFRLGAWPQIVLLTLNRPGV
ncbi:MAG: metallophosphoesterase [Muribaculaceae bacterium]|nr:metallophosphoesterase [Muribaculaceae bacterium]